MCVLRVQLYGQLSLTLIIDTDLTSSYLRKIFVVGGEFSSGRADI